MSERSSRHTKKSSKRYREELSTSSKKKSSYYDHTKHERESKTPPLPKKRKSIDDLIRQRESLKEELQKLEKTKDSRNKMSSREGKKYKFSNSENTKIYKHAKRSSGEFDFKAKLMSPEYNEEHLDSEDEENIIEQRRKQRKQLLEKFNEPKLKIENTIKEDKNISDNKCNNESLNNKTLNTSSIKKNETKHDTTADMFSETDDFIQNNKSPDKTKDDNNSQLSDNWDDPEGYYIIRAGDILKKKFVIKDVLGQGVFANVVRAQDNSQPNSTVAIKIVRNNELMYKTSLKEISILREINEADPENKYHCVKFLSNFMHKGHLCLVLESLHMDLRVVLKKYGKNHGIHMKALISYTRQLLMALRLLKKIGIVHADIKPDNILVNEKKNVLKLCDFGSAAKIDDNEPTPYLVSRFYRAPEIILGVPYNHGIDIWSTACTVYELATGKIMFTGCSNNKMLKCFMDMKGRIPTKLIKKGKFKDQHFNYNNNFLLHKKDEFTGRDKVVELNSPNITRDLGKELHKCTKSLSPGEEKKMNQLKDLLDKMLTLDPNQRFGVADCLKHVFIQEEFEK